MEEPIFDGKVHKLDDKFGYIAHRVFEEMTPLALRLYTEKALLEYAKYLYENDRDTTISFLMDMLEREALDKNTHDEYYTIIYRPAHLGSCLSTYSTVCLKFNRSKDDNIDNKQQEEIQPDDKNFLLSLIYENKLDISELESQVKYVLREIKKMKCRQQGIACKDE